MAHKTLDKIESGVQVKKKEGIKVHSKELPSQESYMQTVKRFPGRPRAYQPAELLKKAEDYVQWCIDNPLYEQKAFGTGYIANMPKMRAMTISGFCVYAGMISNVFFEYEKKPEYKEITARVRDLFRAQKLEGAAANLLEPNLIARELGLTDKQEVEIKQEVRVQVYLPDNFRQREIDK